MVETIIESKCELTRGLEKTHMKPLLAMGDKAAHEIRIDVQRSGQDVGLTGATCSGYFVRSDGVTVPLTGTVQGSAAKVTLSQACYAVPGRFVFVVRLTTGNEISSIFYGDGSVVRSSTDAIIDAEGVIPSLDELLAQSDVVSLHCNLTPENTGFLNAQAIAKMKNGTILLNNARGQLLNEQDVADALNSGKLAAAGLDVVSTEPVRADNPLLTAKNCILTPHISWAPLESRRRIMDTTAENIRAWLNGTPVHVVN